MKVRKAHARWRIDIIFYKAVLRHTISASVLEYRVNVFSSYLEGILIVEKGKLSFCSCEGDTAVADGEGSAVAGGVGLTVSSKVNIT